MEFKALKLGYFKRGLRGFFISSVAPLILVLYFQIEDNHLKGYEVYIPLIIFIFSIIRVAHVFRYYILQLNVVENEILVILLDRNKKKEFKYKKADLNVNLDKTFSYDPIYKLIFIEDGKKQFVQYQIGDWKKEKLLKLYNHLKKKDLKSPA